MLDGPWEMYTVPELDLSGLMILRVLEQRPIYSTVVTVAGVYITVDITRTFLSVATAVPMVKFQ